MPPVTSKLFRAYVPGGPLFATRPFQLRGVRYGKGDLVPADALTKVRHHRLWLSGMASHTQRGPFDKRAPKVAPAVVAEVAEPEIISPAPPIPSAAPAASPVTVQRGEEPASSRRRR